MKLNELFDNVLDYKNIRVGEYVFDIPDGDRVKVWFSERDDSETKSILHNYIKTKIGMEAYNESQDSILEIVENSIDSFPVPKEIIFKVGNRHDITDGGNAHTIFATVLTIIKEEMANSNMPFIYMTAEEESRAKLYKRMVRMFGGQYTKFAYKSRGEVVFVGIDSSNEHLLSDMMKQITG